MPETMGLGWRSNLNCVKESLFPFFKLSFALSSVQSLSHIQLFATPWTAAHQASLSMGLPQARILEWVAMTSSRGIFPTPESNPDLWCPLHCRQVLYPLSHLGSPIFHYWLLKDTEYSFLCNIVNLQALVYLFYV